MGEFDIDDYFDNEPRRPFVFEYKKQDLQVASKLLGKVRIGLLNLLKVESWKRDKSWEIEFNILTSMERRLEDATNQIIRRDFTPKLNY